MNALQLYHWQFLHRCYDWGVTSELDRKSALSLKRGHFDPKFQVQGVTPPIIFARLVRPMNALQYCRWQFSHKKKLCSRLSSSDGRFYTEIGRFAFLRPTLGDLGATYDDHLGLIGKRVVDFRLALIELFSLDVTAAELRANIGWKSANLLKRGPTDPKFQVELVVPTNHSSSQKTRLNDLSYGIKIWTDLSSILSQITLLSDGRTDRQTDWILIARPRLHCMPRGENSTRK